MSEVLRLGLAGLGTVGASLIELVDRRGGELLLRFGRSVSITGVSARDRGKNRGLDLSPFSWFNDPAELAVDPDIDVFVELIGGADGAAAEAVRAALSAGKHVVTANKALLAASGQELAELAERNGVSLNFEAAAAAAIPIVKTLRESLAGDSVRQIYGILNGTCNYILTRMKREGLDFGVCLADAQRLGYAEADPSFDIDGHDSAHKLAILAAIAFGTRIDAEAVYVEGISSVTTADLEAAEELGYELKLLAIATHTDTGIEQRVHPAMVPRGSAIASIDNVTNAIAVEAEFAGQLVLSGPGAGGHSTASAVLSDIGDIARGISVPTFGLPAAKLAHHRVAEIRAHEGGYYLRLTVFDRPGAFAAIASRMAEERISLESIVQRQRAESSHDSGQQEPAKPQPVILITYETNESAIRAALKKIHEDGHTAAEPQLIRIEALR